MIDPSGWSDRQLRAGLRVLDGLLKAPTVQQQWDALVESFNQKLTSYAENHAAEGKSLRFRDAMTRTIRTNYITAYRLGASQEEGRRSWLTEQDRSKIGEYLSDELRYLSGFVERVKGGEDTPEYLRWRTGLYAKALRGVYNEGRMSRVDGDQYEVYYRTTGSAPCDDCLTAEAGSPYSPEDAPRPGADTCQGLDNCHCELETVPLGSSAETDTTPTEEE